MKNMYSELISSFAARPASLPPARQAAAGQAFTASSRNGSGAR